MNILVSIISILNTKEKKKSHIILRWKNVI